MLKPVINELNTFSKMTTVFTGYDHNDRNNDGAFFDEENLTSDLYPLAA